jgi:hypothetical protein
MEPAPGSGIVARQAYSPAHSQSAARAGTTVTIWASESGRPLGPAPRPGQETTRAALIAMAAFVGVGLVAMNGCRLAAWEAGWREFGPRWTSKT